jgi:hypothetical protein
VEQLNKETGENYYVTRYKAVRYSEFYQENKVVMSFSYRLVSLETGEVLMSKVVDKEASDDMYYAAYDGNGDLLMPANKGVVDLRDGARREMRQLLSAPRTVKSIATLSNELLSATGTAVGTAIQSDLMSRLP